MAKEGVVVVAGMNSEKSRVLFLAGQNLRPKAEASDRGFGSRSSLTELDSTTPPSTLSLLSLHTMANPRYVRMLLWSCVCGFADLFYHLLARRQRSKSRSGRQTVKTTKKTTSKKVTVRGPQPLIDAWDKKKTVSQKYVAFLTFAGT